MLNHIPTLIRVIESSNISNVINVSCRGGKTAATQTRCRLRRFGQRAISSNSNHKPFTNEDSFNLRSNTIKNDPDPRKIKATAESISSLQQQAKHYIPQPTWSVQALELTSTHTSITQNELERLARLVLVDVCRNSNHRDDQSIDSLKQDLGNMLQMIQHVTMHISQEPTLKDGVDTRDNDKDDAASSVATYDIIRGVRGIKLRKAIEHDPLQTQDAAQAQDIFSGKNLLSKMVLRGGGHKYFAIETAESVEG